MKIVVEGSTATIVAPMQKLGANALQPLREGLYEGGDKVRTRVRRALRAQTNVLKAASVNTRVTSARAGLSYVIKGEGKGLPITEFPTSTPGGRIASSPWGVSRLFKRSFVKPNSGAFVARLTSKRFPIRKLFGPSIAKEIVKDRSLAAFEDGVRADIVPMIEKRMARLLG